VCFLIDSAAHLSSGLPRRNFNLPRLTSRLPGVATLRKSLDGLPTRKDYRCTFHRARTLSGYRKFDSDPKPPKSWLALADHFET
jgi:hypothetical protein